MVPLVRFTPIGAGRNQLHAERFTMDTSGKGTVAKCTAPVFCRHLRHSSSPWQLLQPRRRAAYCPAQRFGRHGIMAGNGGQRVGLPPAPFGRSAAAVFQSPVVWHAECIYAVAGKRFRDGTVGNVDARGCTMKEVAIKQLVVGMTALMKVGAPVRMWMRSLRTGAES